MWATTPRPRLLHARNDLTASGRHWHHSPVCRGSRGLYHNSEWRNLDCILVSITNTNYNSQRVPRGERLSAFRRIARIVHPDKCHHGQAKEAFQKLLSCSSRSNKGCKNTILSTYLIIRILIKIMTRNNRKTRYYKDIIGSNNIGVCVWSINFFNKNSK